MPFLPVGGQAVIEGVMMRAPSKIAVVVRRPDGDRATFERRFESITLRVRALGLPVIRGAVSLFETMFLGVTALNFSADAATREGAAAPEGGAGGSSALFGALQGLTLVVSLAFGLFLFVVMPARVAPLIQRATGFEGRYAFGLVDGALRLVVFVLYLLLLALWKDMARVLGYHGAEHKAIHALEAGVPLTPANVQSFSRFHPRCGTTFLFIVVVVSIVLFTLIGRPTGIGQHLLRIACMPLIAGIAFEFIRLSGRYYDRPLVRALTWPGMQFQRLTTREPDLEMCAVAIASLERVLDDPTVIRLRAGGGRPDVSFVQ
ncbi:MAG TPA: DUF1385 domain-containing protein [Candidatus Acidoferrales bacterium]|nr:DUF1385 domain-containing protein [Candidatus Acidoferrales bacterium]